jgi:hypothetical protein
LAKPADVPHEAQAQAALIIQKQLIAGGMSQADAENAAAAMVARVTEEMAKGHLPGLPGFDSSVPVIGDEEETTAGS